MARLYLVSASGCTLSCPFISLCPSHAELYVRIVKAPVPYLQQECDMFWPYFGYEKIAVWRNVLLLIAKI